MTFGTGIEIAIVIVIENFGILGMDHRRFDVISIEIGPGEIVILIRGMVVFPLAVDDHGLPHLETFVIVESRDQENSTQLDCGGTREMAQ